MEARGRSSMSSESVCVKKEPECVFNEQVHVKEEAEYTKEEEWEDGAAFHGVSGAALAKLYAGHEVKDELVLGPEGPQPADIVFTLRAAQALDASKQPKLKDCVVRLERVVGHEALFCTNTCRGAAGRAASLTNHVEQHSDMEKELHCNTNISTEKETYKYDICEKMFTMKTRLMEHVMVHIHQSTKQEESGRSFTDNGDNDAAGQALDVRKRPVLKDCVVRLERVGHEAPPSADTRRRTAGRAARRASRADCTSDAARDTHTHITAEKETHVCDICKKRFTLKTQLVDHIMIHSHQSTGQEERRRGVADGVPAGAGARRRPQQAARLSTRRALTRSEATPYHTGEIRYTCGVTCGTRRCRTK